MDTLNLKTAIASNEEGFKYKTGSGVLDWSFPKSTPFQVLYVTYISNSHFKGFLKC